MSRQRVLARLHDELNTLAAFDRLHDLSTNHDTAETGAYASRQLRRSQIAAEIESLKAAKASSLMSHIRVSSGFFLLCAVGYASLRYLLR
jgi:hypothetical protein